jgi:hypothetical protein
MGSSAFVDMLRHLHQACWRRLRKYDLGGLAAVPRMLQVAPQGNGEFRDRRLPIEQPLRDAIA